MTGVIMRNTIAVVYVELLNEGTSVMRPTNAEVLGDNRYRLLPTERYDPEVEEWEFLPESIVRCERVKTDNGAEVMLAVELVD
jgi:hypothetical protein